MRRTSLLFLVIVSCALFVGGCKQENGSMQKPQKATMEDKENKVGGEDAPSYPSKDAGSVVYDSRLGYTCKYNPTVFTLDDTGEDDQFLYQTAEKLSAPIYMSVREHTDFDEDALVEGLLLQLDMKESDVQETDFGHDSVKSRTISVTRDQNGIKQVQNFYVISKKKSVLLIEMGGYVGMPSKAEHQLQEIADTFSVIEK